MTNATLTARPMDLGAMLLAQSVVHHERTGGQIVPVLRRIVAINGGYSFAVVRGAEIVSAQWRKDFVDAGADYLAHVEKFGYAR